MGTGIVLYVLCALIAFLATMVTTDTMKSDKFSYTLRFVKRFPHRLRLLVFLTVIILWPLQVATIFVIFLGECCVGLAEMCKSIKKGLAE